MKTLAAQTAARWLWHSGRQVGSSLPSPLSPVCSRVPLSFHKRLFQLAPTTSHITTITTTATTTTTITRHTHSGSRHQHSGPATADPRQTKQRFNVGAFGAGRIGRMHLKNVCGHQRLNLKWIVEDNEEMRDKARDELCLYDTPFSSTSNVPQLLDDASLDGVFILTPTETHAGLIIQALNKGKAVFVEKPTAETRDEIEQCYTLAETKGAHLFTGFQRRLDPVMCDLYSAVRDREVVGKMYNIKTVSRDSPKPSYEFLKNTDPDGCNILSDMAVHDVDLVVWLTQAEVPELIYVVTHAHDAILAEKGIDDSLMVLIKYKSGIIATIDSCRETTYGYDIRVEVFGSEGMVMVENPRETTSVIDGASGGTVRRLFHSFPERFEKAFQMEIDHFVLCMDGTATAPVTKTQALLTARIIEKGVQSFREKRPVYF